MFTALTLLSSACDNVRELPSPDLADRLAFDGSAPLDLEGPHLGGNQLPLDGGTDFAHLVFEVSDSDTGLPTPARIIFRPPPGAGFADSITSGTPDPQSKGSFTGAVVGPGVLGSPEGVLLAGGQGVVPVPAGTYTLFITRGPEYEALETTVTLGAGEARPVRAMLDRTVDTRGWLAADMHVHVGRSFDSKLPAERRVVSMVTNGVEVIVPTDHNVNTDLGPVAAALGYGPELVGTVVGNEFNFAQGHGGAYPVPYDPAEPYGGAPPYQPLGPNGCAPPVVGINCFPDLQAFPMMRAQVPGQTVITLNHPYWPGADLGYFTNVGWGVGTANPPPAPLASAGLFDAMEVLNGYQVSGPSEDALVADWFALLAAGHRVTALGNSDTHKINWVRSGFPRTWLRLPNDRPGEITGALLSEAIKKGRAIASTGPFIDLTVDGARIGDSVIPVTAGQVTIDLTVDAPAWISVDRVRLYVNGRERRSFAVTPGKRPVFHQAFTETVSGDAFVVAVTSGSKALPPDVVGEYSRANGYEMMPWAITNPVWVDGDGDGLLQPPPLGPSSRPLGPAARRAARAFDGTVPEGCDPSEALGEHRTERLAATRPGQEPPLDAQSAPESVLMPLLFPSR